MDQNYGVQALMNAASRKTGGSGPADAASAQELSMRLWMLRNTLSPGAQSLLDAVVSVPRDTSTGLATGRRQH